MGDVRLPQRAAAVQCRYKFSLSVGCLDVALSGDEWCSRAVVHVDAAKARLDGSTTYQADRNAARDDPVNMQTMPAGMNLCDTNAAPVR